MIHQWKHAWPDVSQLRPLVLRATYLPSQHPVDRVIDGAVLTFVVFATVSITLAQGAMLLALSAWLITLAWTQERQRLSLPLLLPLGMFVLASVLATLTAVDPDRSLYELRNIFQLAFFFLLVNHLRPEQHTVTLTRILVIMGCLMAAYGLSQSFVQGEAFRIRGTMSIWMTFAGIMMLLATLTLAQLVFAFDRLRSGWLIAALLMLIAALVMTHTRGAWLGFAVGAGLILACRKKIFLLLLPVLALTIFVAAPQTVRDRVRSIVDPQDVTARQRIYMWGSGLQMLRDHPWTGVGLNGVKGVYPVYRDPRAIEARWGHLHNNIIQLAVERGLIGLSCWLWIWVAFYRDAWRTYRALGEETGTAKALVVGGLAAVTAFHVEGLFEYTFGDSEVVTLVYFIMALTYVVSRQRFSDAGMAGRRAQR